MSRGQRIEARACANFAGLRFGDVVPVDPDDPYIQELLNARPPLLVAVGVLPAVASSPDTSEAPGDLADPTGTVVG